MSSHYPAVLEIQRRNALHGATVAPDRTGYEEALRRVNNNTGEGSLYADIATKYSLDAGTFVIVVAGTYQPSPTVTISPINTKHIGGLDIIVFDHPSLEQMRQIRKSIPRQSPSHSQKIQGE